LRYDENVKIPVLSWYSNDIMKVFIENEAGSNQKNLFDEKTLTYRKTVTVSREYPFPYGFILNTTSGDGDNLDCFILTKLPLKSQEIIDVDVIGMFEEIEDGEEDNKILAVPVGEQWSIDADMEQLFRNFTAGVFAHLPGKVKVVGRFLGREEALAYIAKVST
jgi:inorganic pyrophosphatase